ncbi:phospholipase D family nuclease [Candidatus Nucleicultrix amoebiphila]|jgi:phospholipase D|uniref:phospholipase D family nuclease n=1 Tax=Candidatus Nucleicultrix amoebiphila TaxID=1509244 RepID=UPI000A26C291|nr:phospholipase D family protein [Candidatus Nucleicultrix amoebiphila]
MYKKITHLPISKTTIAAALLMGMVSGYTAHEFLHPHWQESSNSNAKISACFTPQENCTQLIIEAINNAKSSIFVQAYSFTSKPIARALIEAKEQGKTVALLFDRSQLKDMHSMLFELQKSGLKVSFDDVPGIAHNKVMIIDQRFVITGSFNWTKAAQSRNAENVLFINDPQITKLYMQNWELRSQQAWRIN